MLRVMRAQLRRIDDKLRVMPAQLRRINDKLRVRHEMLCFIAASRIYGTITRCRSGSFHRR